MLQKTFLKRKYESLPEYIALANKYVQGITAEAYSNVDMLSNQVLNRNPYASDFFRNLLFEKQSQLPTWRDVLRKLARYFCRSGYIYLIYLIVYVTQRFASFKRKPLAIDPLNDLYIIDTFVFPDLVLREQQYKEQFFPGLYEVLRKHNKQFVILPKFVPGVASPRQVLSMIRLLDRSPYNFVSEYQLLHFSDLLRTLRFIIQYPLEVLHLAKKIPRRGPVENLFITEFVGTLDHPTFLAYIRYLVGKRLSRLLGNRKKLISFCENQVIDKNLYRGVRETAESVSIYGCQLFIPYPAYLSANIMEAEKRFQITPDHVLVNGRAYIKGDTSLDYRSGPSLRYGWIFSTPVDWSNKRNCVIFLCYFVELNDEMIKICRASSILSRQSVAVRPHPAPSDKRLPHLPKEWYLTDRNKPELIETAAILITSESGTAVEAAAMGVSVIIVASQSSFTSNPMLEVGKGKIWEIVFDAEELDAAYTTLMQHRVQDTESIRQLAAFYKNECFMEPNEKNMVEAFDLA